MLAGTLCGGLVHYVALRRVLGGIVCQCCYNRHSLVVGQLHPVYTVDLFGGLLCHWGEEAF